MDNLIPFLKNDCIEKMLRTDGLIFYPPPSNTSVCAQSTISDLCTILKLRIRNTSWWFNLESLLTATQCSTNCICYMRKIITLYVFVWDQSIYKILPWHICAEDQQTTPTVALPKWSCMRICITHWHTEEVFMLFAQLPVYCRLHLERVSET